MSDSQAGGCAERLTKMGLEPICPDAAYEVLRETAFWHEACADQEPETPIQVLGCYNRRTGEWRFDLPDQIVESCRALNQQDPEWELTQCFCCCDGPD